MRCAVKEKGAANAAIHEPQDAGANPEDEPEPTFSKSQS